MNREDEITKLIAYFSPEEKDEHFLNQLEKEITTYH